MPPPEEARPHPSASASRGSSLVGADAAAAAAAVDAVAAAAAPVLEGAAVAGWEAA